MIKKLAILSLFGLILGCSTSENEQKQRIPDGTYRPSGFHSFIDHGSGNTPVSLLKADSLYHFYYTTESNEWGHLTSRDMLSWQPAVSISIPEHGYGEVIYDWNDFTDLNTPWNLLWSDGDKLFLSTSSDGNEWSSIGDNPVLTASGIPSVNWSEDLEEWILSITNNNDVTIYASSNLSDWDAKNTLNYDDVEKSSLLNINDQWVLLMQGEQLMYQPGIYDGNSFIPASDPVLYEGLNHGIAAVMSTTDETVIIAKNKTNDDQLPTFTAPITISMLEEQLRLAPCSTFQNQIVGKRRATLNRLLTDGPSWYSFTIEQTFNELEIIVADNSSDLRIFWDVTKQTINLSGSALAEDNIQLLPISLEPSENLKIDLLIDHASVDLFLNNGTSATTILTLPDTFFSKVALTVDGESYDAKGVLYDIGI